MTTEAQPACLLEAVNLALDHAMAEDPMVVLLGEDIGVNGGVFRATDGLQKKYGDERVLDTPLAEALIAGLSVGMATQGIRPVAEIQFMGFIFATYEHLAAHASRMRNRTRGRLHCPMVIRVPFGGGIHAPELHSESTEAMLAHIPGLRVVVASSPARAYGLLLSSIRDPDPVVFLEPKRLYRSPVYKIQADGKGLPLDRCFTLMEGQDVTLVSWGAMVSETLKAAEVLSARRVSAEVIDVATLKPFDLDTLLASVRKTGRAVIVHEAARSFGAGAEISASITEQAFADLLAPVQRVTGYDCIMPYYRNEHYYMPGVDEIVRAVLRIL